jgi:probable F420-dependent oxidoreductase
MSVKLGVIFPQAEMGNDPMAIRDYAQAVEQLGYNHLLAYEHVLGASHERFESLGLHPPYTHKTPFHEPFVLFGFLAGLTTNLELVTGILVLPQRQTVLVAKQAAEVDVLTRGRLRLGVGIGWNPVEFEALGENFRNRGRRCEEQVALLRQFWTKELVDFDGAHHTVHSAGINPLPVQRPIPIWMGAMAEPAIKRAARIADGWFPQFPPGPDGAATIERLRDYLRNAGRNPADFGIEGRIRLAGTDEDQRGAMLEGWNELGATHISFDTMGVRLATAQDHIDAIRRLRDLAGNA